MRKLGIVGGTSWSSTALYYEHINRGVAQRLGALHSARLAIESLDLAPVAAMEQSGDWAGVAALYAHDGVMFRPTASDTPMRGRGAILDAFRARPARTTRHICSNIVIHVESAAAARGESAMLLFTGGPEPLVGSFHDRFVLTSDGWRFAERRGSLLFAG